MYLLITHARTPVRPYTSCWLQSVIGGITTTQRCVSQRRSMYGVHDGSYVRQGATHFVAHLNGCNRCCTAARGVGGIRSPSNCGCSCQSRRHRRLAIALGESKTYTKPSRGWRCTSAGINKRARKATGTHQRCDRSLIIPTLIPTFIHSFQSQSRQTHLAANAKVCDSHRATGCQEDVFGLQVSMHNSPAVQIPAQLQWYRPSLMAPKGDVVTGVLAIKSSSRSRKQPPPLPPVSYTHLTLPTIYSV